MLHNYYEVLKKNHIFYDISSDDMKALSPCFKPIFSSYLKGASVFSDGDVYVNLGIIVDGIVNIIKDDTDGNRVILEQAEPGSVLDESLNEKKNYKVNVSAVASTDCDILAIPFNKLFTVCKQNCPFHVKLIGNIIRMLASNHNALTMKMEYLSKKSVRHRLMSFLNFQAEKHKSSEFHINFDRKELAEFLFVDRSALSRELGRMRRAKIIEFSKNRFKILKSGI